MEEKYHLLDQRILNGLLQGKAKALLLREDTQLELLKNDKFLDQQLVKSCLEAGLPVIDEKHPYVVPGCLLFFANELSMAELTGRIDDNLFETTEDVWIIPENQRSLGQFLGYPAGALYYALSYQEQAEQAELLIRYGYKRFRIEIDQAIDNIQRLWLMFPDDDQTTYVEYISLTESTAKMYELHTHDYNGLEKVIKECGEEREKQQQKNVFERLRDFWNG